LSRTLSLLWTQLRGSTLLGLTYRWELFADALLSLFWTATAVLPLVLPLAVMTTIPAHALLGEASGRTEPPPGTCRKVDRLA